MTTFVGLFVITVAATFLAHDTLRVMEVMAIPAILHAASYAEGFWLGRQRGRAIVMLFAQGAYSFVVYGHLRTFEASRALNLLAAAISVITLGLCILWSWPPSSTSRRALRPSGSSE